MNRPVIAALRSFLYLTAMVSAVQAESAPPPVRRLSLDERIEYQRRIEEVYWRHRIWPESNTEPKPALSSVMPDSAIREKVEAALARSTVLVSYAQKPLDGNQLQAEIDRMARETKAPETLRELFAALYDDPFLIAECLARPSATQRSIDAAFAGDAGELDAQLQLARSKPLDGSALAPPAQGYATAAVTTTGCTDDTWTPIALAAVARSSHAVVWTGAEMIVWGGYWNDTYLASGERYDPATNSWTPTSMTGNPTAASGPAAVWTGSEMIVWGGSVVGSVYLNSGGRYNPSTDAWSGTSTTGAPSGRRYHSAVWTGSRMIVWGGFHDELLEHFLNDGGRYDPSTNTWAATSTGANVPAIRANHSAVWTGSEMIVWGGGGDGALDTGGRYNPVTNSWQPTSTVNCPLHRTDHTAVWTGSRMIVWGGRDQQPPGGTYLASGGIYDPATNTWVATSIPVGAQTSDHTAIWTGSEMIVWGGESSQNHEVNTGRRYDPAAISGWRPTSVGPTTPNASSVHTAVWTGLADRHMIVFAGNKGASYCAGECTPGATSCSDRNSCTTDVCQGGACVSTPIVCTSSDPCLAPAACDVQTGSCTVGDPIPDGISCDDGNPCTAACPTCGLDICLNGVCGCSHPPGPCTGTLRTYNSTDVPKSISGTGTPLVASTITVSGAGAYLKDLDVKTFIRHTNASNLDITLTSPAGTVMTLTTDNGETNDDVFNGTLWDDDADPGIRGSSIVTDAGFADKALASPLVPEEALGAFIGENPNGTWTLRISDDADLDGGSLDHWSLNLRSLSAAPAAVTTNTSASGLPLAIPAPLPARDTRATITVAGAGTEIGTVKITTGITHTNSGDLEITLTSPAGTSITLTSANGGTADNVFGLTDWDDRANLGGQVPYTTNNGLVTDHAYVTNVHATPLVPEEAMAAFNGENPNGAWTLAIVDTNPFSGTGSLNSATLRITTIGPCPQPCDIACDDNDACTFDSCDPASGCAHVNDAQLGESTGLVWAAGNKTNLGWASTPNATGYTVYVGNRGTLDELLTVAEDSCVAAAVAGPPTGEILTEIPAPSGLIWYLVRPKTACVEGGAGSATAGPRIQDTFACNDGNACTADTCAATGCLHTPVVCDDGIACTDDSCSVETGCIHAPNNALCADDGNPCTDETCNPATGCLHPNNTAACDDGSACTPADVCSGGVCVGSGVANHLVISQVQSSGDGGNPTDDEFIEIYNPTSAAVSLLGWSLQNFGAFGSTDVRTFSTGDSVPAHGWFLVATSSYNGSVAADRIISSFVLSTSGDNVALVHSTFSTSCSNGSIVDRVGWGGTFCFESVSTPPLTANNSILRRPGGSCGNFTDTNVNSADFVSQVPSMPRNRFSTPQP